MLEDFYTRPRAIARFMRAPLGPYMGSFADEMRARGHTHAVVRVQLCFVARLNRWLERHRLRVDELDETRLEEFLRSKYRKRGLGIPKTVSSFLEHLRRSGVVAVPAAPRRRLTQSEIIERDFTSYLEQQRGLAASTVVGYVAGARAFLASRFGSGPARLARLNAGQITDFVTDYARLQGATATQTIATALRSFLRFLQQRGDVVGDLASSVPSVARWHLATLPTILTPDDIGRMLGECDGRTAARRDRAIVVLLARLGLRACEVVRLTLDDIDWNAGELTIRGKGRRSDRMPLPHDVGAALAAYIRNERPRCASRRVFVRARAPHDGLCGSSSLGTVVRRLLRRAGLRRGRGAAHLLRHAAATQMLRRGAPLHVIGDALRHRDLRSTMIYAKVDLCSLRTLASPWLGGEP